MVQNTIEKYMKKSKRKRNKIDQEILKIEDLEYLFLYVRQLLKHVCTHF